MSWTPTGCNAGPNGRHLTLTTVIWPYQQSSHGHYVSSVTAWSRHGLQYASIKLFIRTSLTRRDKTCPRNINNNCWQHSRPTEFADLALNIHCNIPCIGKRHYWITITVLHSVVTFSPSYSVTEFYVVQLHYVLWLGLKAKFCSRCQLKLLKF